MISHLSEICAEFNMASQQQNAALVFIKGASAERGSHQMASQNSVLFPIGNTTHTHTHECTAAHMHTHTLRAGRFWKVVDFPFKEPPPVKELAAAGWTRLLLQNTNEQHKNPSKEDNNIASQWVNVVSLMAMQAKNTVGFLSRALAGMCLCETHMVLVQQACNKRGFSHTLITLTFSRTQGLDGLSVILITAALILCLSATCRSLTMSLQVINTCDASGCYWHTVGLFHRLPLTAAEPLQPHL